ncbi:MAG: hypothetical protein CSA07_04890 [Bacteroidia bacterium]|nr:MAG: hypothetical protein CSA07_04890 [Bacteroidia bacterium]
MEKSHRIRTRMGLLGMLCLLLGLGSCQKMWSRLLKRHELVDARLSGSYAYSPDRKKILWLSSDGSELVYEWRDIGADVQTFRVTSPWSGRDAQHVYVKGKRIDGVDHASFAPIRAEEGWSTRYRDRYHVYTIRYPDDDPQNPDLAVIAGAKPESYVWLGRPSSCWARDSQHYFFYDQIAGVDYASFRLLTPILYADKDSVYAYQGLNEPLLSLRGDGTPPDEYVVMEEHAVRSRAHLYVRCKPLHGGCHTPRPLVQEIAIRDPESIRLWTMFRSWAAVDGVVYYLGMPVEGADAESFAPLNSYYDDFGADLQHVYDRTKAIPGVAPEDVSYNSQRRTVELDGRPWSCESWSFEPAGSSYSR